MTGRMRKQRPAPKRPGISKKPPRTPKLNPDVMEKAFGNEPLRACPAMSYGCVFGCEDRCRLVSRPTLRDRWITFVNSIGGRLLRYGR